MRFTDFCIGFLVHLRSYSYDTEGEKFCHLLSRINAVSQKLIYALYVDLQPDSNVNASFVCDGMVFIGTAHRHNQLQFSVTQSDALTI